MNEIFICKLVHILICTELSNNYKDGQRQQQIVENKRHEQITHFKLRHVQAKKNGCRVNEAIAANTTLQKHNCELEHIGNVK